MSLFRIVLQIFALNLSYAIICTEIPMYPTLKLNTNLLKFKIFGRSLNCIYPHTSYYNFLGNQGRQVFKIIFSDITFDAQFTCSWEWWEPERETGWHARNIHSHLRPLSHHTAPKAILNLILFALVHLWSYFYIVKPWGLTFLSHLFHRNSVSFHELWTQQHLLNCCSFVNFHLNTIN